MAGAKNIDQNRRGLCGPRRFCAARLNHGGIRAFVGTSAAVGALFSAPGLAAAATSDDRSLRGVTVSPARAEGTAIAGQRIGPFSFTNNTTERYRVRAFPVLLGQARRGDLLVLDDAASRSRARRLLSVRLDGAGFVPGQSRPATAVLKRTSPDHNFYGGVLFRAVPVNASESQLQSILQINAPLFLRPRPGLQRVRMGTEPISAQKASERRLRFLVPLANRGNVDVRPSGALRVRNASGRIVARVRTKQVQILPGSVVDLPATTAAQLPAGDYTMAATLRARGRSVVARGRMRLFGVNELESRDAKLAGLPSPRAYIGEPVKIKARFENKGNVRFAPDAIVEARHIGAGGSDRVLERARLDSEAANPGESGQLEGSISLPSAPEGRSYELTVTLRAGERELDASTISVTPVVKPSVVTRATTWARSNAALIAGLLLLALVAMAAAFAHYIRALKQDRSPVWARLSRSRSEKGPGPDIAAVEPAAGPGSPPHSLQAATADEPTAAPLEPTPPPLEASAVPDPAPAPLRAIAMEEVADAPLAIDEVLDAELALEQRASLLEATIDSAERSIRRVEERLTRA